MTLDPTYAGYLSALGLGLLIGVVRERQRDHGGHTPAGMRTHTIAALAGAVAWTLGLPVFLVVLGAIGLLAYGSYRLTDASDPGQTGEVALLTTVLLGALAQQSPGLASSLAVLVALLLQARERLHRLGRDLISEREVRDGLLLLAAALLVLPLLPDESIGPGGALNPQKLWRLVVLVMAVSALGHVALRVVGSGRGLAIAGFFAGFVSSTAAIAGFGQRVRVTPGLLRPSVGAAMFAALASLLLMFPVLATVSATLLKAVMPTLLGFGLVLAIGGALGLRGGSGDEPAPTQESRMFRFTHALYFAGFMAGVLVVSALLRQVFGEAGALATAFLAAIAEVHAAVASIGQMVGQGLMGVETARHAILAVLAASVIARGAVAWVSGGAAYGLRVSAGLLAAWVAAALATVLLPAGL
ncbi:MgtC/SapB family protein [Silanimonas sp.]|uniref:MgtC/SapB family protein n=1 Tax=Silanimonas sp. TaxID=1929290 RepID=UPI0022C1D053|nr:MgtC/SapB family protein [Silanimonas sp.]MCZ8062109.1 MgtC/SapB family protein [Silanimonas sp.]